MNEYLIMLYCISCCQRGCNNSRCLPCPPPCPPPCPQPFLPPRPQPRDCECEVCRKNPCECGAGGRFSQGFHGEVFGYSSQLYPHLYGQPTCPPPPQPRQTRCDRECSPPPRCEKPHSGCRCDEYSQYNPRYRR